MRTAVSVIIQIAMFCLGAAVIPVCLLMFVRFLAYGDSHPLNAVLGFFGVAPVVLNLADIDWFSTGLLEMGSSIFTACMFYFGLASLLLLLTQEVADWAERWANIPIYRRKKPGV